MISSFYNKTVSTQRLANVSGSKRESWGTNLASLACHIQPVEGSPADSFLGGFYNTFKMYCAPDADVQIGDRVIDGSTTYVVKGLKTYDFGGSSSEKHKLIALVLPEA